MAGYTYKGKGPDALEAPRPEPKKTRRKVAECGTPAGYNRHHRLGEEVCEPCRITNNAARARRTGYRTTGRKNNPVRVCGTYSAFNGHKAAGEEACDPCRDARNAYLRARRAKKKAGVRDLPDGMVTIGEALDELLVELQGRTAA